MAQKDFQYEFSGFLADVRYIEELKRSWSWSSSDELDAHVQQYFVSVHGASGIDYVNWRYKKWKAVMVYVARNIESFNFGDLAVVGPHKDLAHGKLFRPIFDYAIDHDVTDIAKFPEPRYFHDPAA